MALRDAVADAAISTFAVLRRLKAGYPGGWKQYIRGSQGNKPSAFWQPSSPEDRRSLIPPLGLREYWYPAIPDKAIGWRKPLGVRICGIDIAFFRDKNGVVQALYDYCPHRGSFLSWGECVWKGYLSCPYHGATFDGNGECVEFITEGPDSRMVRRLKARKFPTITLKDVVFVWMGEGEPVPPEEDIPPEFFDEKALVHTAWDYWPMNWVIALENAYDAHNAFWVHRDSLRMLMSRTGGRPRTPIGYRVKVVNNRAVNALYGVDKYYADKDGKVPYQMYYPRVDQYWPLHRWRLLWTWLLDRRPGGRGNRPPNPEEWGGEGFGWVLPGMRRSTSGDEVASRWCIPVEENITRIFYTGARWPRNTLEEIKMRAQWPVHNWVHFNFQNQDRDATATIQYGAPEFLSSTDAIVVALRKLITDHGRGLKKPIEVIEETPAESMVYEADRAFGVNPVPEVATTRSAGG